MNFVEGGMSGRRSVRNFCICKKERRHKVRSAYMPLDFALTLSYLEIPLVSVLFKEPGDSELVC